MSSTPKKVIKKRVRNRYGMDTSHMGFVKQYVVNEATGRANQLFRCLKCCIKTPKLCNMIDHQKTHRNKKSSQCPNCHRSFVLAGSRDSHVASGKCLNRTNEPVQNLAEIVELTHETPETLDNNDNNDSDE